MLMPDTRLTCTRMIDELEVLYDFRTQSLAIFGSCTPKLLSLALSSYRPRSQGDIVCLLRGSRDLRLDSSTPMKRATREDENSIP